MFFLFLDDQIFKLIVLYSCGVYVSFVHTQINMNQI